MTHPDSPALLRQYNPGDSSALRALAADTAFFGAPVEHFLDDRTLFLDVVYCYYQQFESESLIVAVQTDALVGFVAGCPDTAAKQRLWRHRMLPGIVRQLLMGRYVLGRRTLAYAWAAVIAGVRQQYPTVDLATYPAHLHINVLEAARGQGVGQRLLQACFDQLEEIGIAGVHLRTTSLNLAACRLYERVGMRLLAARTTSAWSPFTTAAVENRIYGLRLPARHIS